MSDVHALNILPSQAVIDSIATYRLAFDKDPFNYAQLLGSLQQTFYEHNFMCNCDNTHWMREKGRDYLNNPKLFSHAPLTYLCIFLGEMFKNYDLPELQERMTPHILECALIRLQEFRLN